MPSMMRDMVRHIAVARGYIAEEHTQPTFLDTYQKWSTTNDPLPDREMQYHKFGEHEGYGHAQALHEIPSEHRLAHAPDATGATRLYGPSRTILHSPTKGDVVFHHDEPDFQKITHELHHTVGKLVKHPTNANAFRNVLLHTDVIHSKTYDRKPNETAQQFSNRVHTEMENNGTVYSHNEVEEGLDPQERSAPHHVMAFMDPLETWHDTDRETGTWHVVGHGGQITHENKSMEDSDGRFRDGQITQDFHHVFKVHK